jgi:hypothetical protein
VGTVCWLLHEVFQVATEGTRSLLAVILVALHRPMHLTYEKGRPWGGRPGPSEGARSADVPDPFLSQRLGGGGWLSGKLKHCCCLTFGQVRQKLNLPVGKFQRVVVCARLAFVKFAER